MHGHCNAFNGTKQVQIAQINDKKETREKKSQTDLSYGEKLINLFQVVMKINFLSMKFDEFP